MVNSQLSVTILFSQKVRKHPSLPQIIVPLAVIASLASAHAEDLPFQIHVLKPDGTPARGAKAVFRGYDRQKIDIARPVEATAVANEQGFISINIPRGSSGILILDSPGYALRVLDVDATYPPTALKKLQPLTEKLTPAYSIRGTTADAQGLPIAGVDVAVQSEYAPYTLGFKFNNPSLQNGLRMPELTTQSKADGSFSLRGFDFTTDGWLNLKNASVSVLAYTRRAGVFHAGGGGFNWPLRKHPIPLVLNPEETIQGQVFDSASGQAVPGAELKVTSSYPYPYQDNGAKEQTATSLTPSAKTDAQGRFKLSFVTPSPYILISIKSPAGFWNSTLTWKGASIAELKRPRTELKVPLHRIVSISGQVIDAQAVVPIAPLQIAVASEEELAGGWKNELLTPDIYNGGTPVQTDGTFKMNVPAGNAKFTVQGPYAGNGTRVYETRFDQVVPPEGDTGAKFIVRRPPSVLLHCPDSPDTDKLPLERSHLVAQTRQPDGTITEQINDGPFWMLPVSHWGTSLQVRFISRCIQGAPIDRELIPWTSYTADAKRAAFEVHLPKDAFALPLGTKTG